MLLQVQPSLRPSCDKILQLPSIVRRMEEKVVEVDEIDPELMKTIKCPNNMYYL